MTNMSQTETSHEALQTMTYFHPSQSLPPDALSFSKDTNRYTEENDTWSALLLTKNAAVGRKLGGTIIKQDHVRNWNSSKVKEMKSLLRDARIQAAPPNYFFKARLVRRLEEVRKLLPPLPPRMAEGESGKVPSGAPTTAMVWEANMADSVSLCDDFCFFHHGAPRAGEIAEHGGKVIGLEDPRMWANRWFNNWYPCEFYDPDGVRFFCVEQFAMTAKAILFMDESPLENTRIAMRLLARDQSRCASGGTGSIRMDGKRCKQTGNLVQGFDERIWDQYKADVVSYAILLKFTSNSYLKAKLLATGNRTLCEASDVDSTWGIGVDPIAAPCTKAPDGWVRLDSERQLHHGQNLLGRCLMRVRSYLAQSAAN